VLVRDLSTREVAVKWIAHLRYNNRSARVRAGSRPEPPPLRTRFPASSLVSSCASRSPPASSPALVSAYIGYEGTRLLDHGSDVAEARTTSTLIVLIVSLWTLLVLARPLSGWKLALMATMAATVTLIVAIPPLGHGVFLLDVTPLRLAIAGTLGAAGALLVELTYRSITLLVHISSKRTDPAESRQGASS
jgi:hypothetical protein